MQKTTATRIILAIFTLIPLWLRRCIFRALFRIFYHLSSRHRLITLHNLVKAFPEKGTAELSRIAKGAYRNLAVSMAEFFEIPKLTLENGKKKITVEGLEHYHEALARRQGILFFTAHFGNWELLAAYFALLNQRINIIYRPLDNRVLDDCVAWVRSCTGNKLLPKTGAAKKVVRLLKSNEIVGTLIDQNVAWQEGVFVPFFGRPAATTNGFAALALNTEAPVLPAFLVRKKNGTYKMIIMQAVDIIKTGDYEQDILENTKRFTAIIEDIVRQYPDQWFWLHQRWKTKLSQIPKT